MTALLRFVTDFADQAVVLPSALAVALVLLVLGWWRGAAAWVLVIMASFGLVLTLKLIFQGCGSPLPHHLLRSPSGHTMAGTVLYGGLLVIAGIRPRVSIAGAVLIAMLIATTRLALHMHTVPEVLLGGVIGVAGVATFSALISKFADNRPKRGVARWRLLPIIFAMLPVLVLHGQQSHIESSIHRLAVRYVSAMLHCTAPSS